MRYFYTTLFFFVFVMLVTNITNFSYEQKVDAFDLDETPYTGVDIDVSNINVNVSTTLDKDLKIEHLYSPTKNPSSNLYSYRDGEKLVVREYNYNNPGLIAKKDTVNIYLPQDYHFNDLTVKTNSGKIGLDGVTADAITVKTDIGDTDMRDVKSTDMKIEGNTLGLDMTGVNSDSIKVNLNTASVQMVDMIVNDAEINIEGESELSIGKLLGKNVRIDAPQTSIKLLLSDSLDYLISTSNKISNRHLTKSNQGYEYRPVELDNTITFNIDNSDDISVDFTSYSESDDSDD